MTIRQISWQRYAVPFVTPFQTAHAVTTHREGLILRLTCDDGLEGVGEAAPLAEFGGGDVTQSESLLRQIVPDLIGIDLLKVASVVDHLLPTQPSTSALRFALDTALFDLQSRRQGVRLADLLSPDARPVVPVNATIGQSTSDQAVRLARDAAARGFMTIKLKVGMAGSISAEVERVAAVRNAIGPEVALRLDANGAWSPEQAIRILNELAQFDIEFVEQPVAPNDLDGLVKVRRSVSVLVAADEAVTNLELVRRVIEAEAADVLVIKPMVCGGLRTARQIIALANDTGLGTIVTSSLETGVGVAATLHLAATLPDESPACGLATLDLLEDDLIVEALDIVGGRMRLPEGPGIGVAVDEAELNRFSASD